MEINVQDYETVIKSLVWKFRNLGFADNMFAPVIDTSSEGRSTSKMANIDEGGTTERKRFRYTVANFEDLISEANVVFVELTKQFASMELFCTDCPYPCTKQTLKFEQALVQALQNHFTNMYTGILREKRTAYIRPLGDNDENVEVSHSFIVELGRKYLYDELPENLRDLARDILDQKFSDFKKGPITKYLMEKGWKREDVRRIFRENIV
jgi:hypothetical protein